VVECATARLSAIVSVHQVSDIFDARNKAEWAEDGTKGTLQSTEYLSVWLPREHKPS